ncbi:ATP-binding cassette, subfamily B (MDR/TAP), member 7, partial [Pancytospora epiphaga]
MFSQSMGPRVLKDYYKLTKDIMKVSVFKHRYLRIIALVAMVMTFISTYYMVKVSSCIGLLSKTFRTEEFYNTLKTFFLTSLLALGTRYLPSIVYTFTLQTTMRREFVMLLKRYLELGYNRFHTKTPGEMRYCIFIKATCTPMCTQVVIFELARMVGNTIFSTLKVKNDINFASGIVFAILPVIYLSSVFYFITGRLKYQERLLAEQESTSSNIYDKLINYDLIKTYNLENTETNLLYRNLSRQTDAQINMGRFWSKGEYLLNYVLYAPYILVLWVCLQNRSINEERFFSVTVLYIMMADNLDSLGRQLLLLFYYLVQVKFTEVADSNSERNDRIPEDLDGFNQSIRFENVTLYYDSTEVIREINAEIRRGEKIGIVGPNGTGKSTFIKSLMGFTKYSGDIFFDNQNTRSLSWKSVIKQISYIPQDDYTSDDTVMNNLRLGDKNATDEFIVSRARAFGAHETFVGLPDGYETETGPRGNRLSGGQLQKLSLVRAAVKDAPIFVLDEATAAMDKSYESELLGKLFDILKDRTIIMIVHGKDYLAQFDRLFFFNNGRLEQ